jgi:hypothetical protein
VADWKVAPALDQLLGQLNELAPLRSKAADGAIGDAAHASRGSDHNPHWCYSGQAYVTARDYTHDRRGGLDCAQLAAALCAGKDRRVKYVIWSEQIMAGFGGPAPWTWRPYRGPNAHTKHLHLSVVADARSLVRIPWLLPGLQVAPPLQQVTTSRPRIRRGDAGALVMLVQRYLGVASEGEPGYGLFGPATEAAVRRYQQRRGLSIDGIVGAATWASIDAGLRGPGV